MAASASPLSAAKPARVGLGCAVLFGLVFACAGFAAFWFASLRPLLRSAESSNWTETPCEILSSNLASHSDSDGSTYRVDIRYRYERYGRTYEGDRYDFSTGSTNIGVKRMRAAVADHPPGSRTVCYVDPRHPESAVLVRGVAGGVWAGFFTLLFPAFGALFVFMTWKSARKAKAEAISPLGSAESAPGFAIDAEPVAAGETMLKPATGRVGSFLAMLGVALFWNGIVSVFVFHAVKEFGRGFTGWFLPVFLIPFVLVGLLLIAVAFQAFSRLFAPGVEVRLDPSLLRLGARVPFSWKLDGRGVRRLAIRLVAREEATYRQGTNTATDKSDCHRDVVFESTDILGLTAGRAEIVLPAEDAAPAFAAKNNKLVWELVFDGEIPWRADIDDRFVLPVRGPASFAPPAATPEPRAFGGGPAGLTLWTVDRLLPGETLVFSLARDASAKPGALTVQLGWFTEGRGTRDAGIVWRQEVPELAPGADRGFEVRLPAEPWSFSGKLVSVAWRLEVLDPKGEPLVGVSLIVSQNGEPVALPALAKESPLSRWKKFAPSFR